MKVSSIILRVVAVLLTSVLLAYRLIVDADSVFVFNPIVQLVIIIILLGILVFNFRKDRKHYRTSKAKASFLPTAFGVLCIISLIMVQLFLNSRDNSRVILQVSNDGGFNACGFEFREDGTYKFFNGSGLGVDYFRGSYSISDTIITLDKSTIDKCTSTNRLAIRGKIIYQIDEQHRIVDKDMDFTINVDNRTGMDSH